MIPREVDDSGSNDKNDKGNGDTDGGDSGNEPNDSSDSSNDTGVDASSDTDPSSNDASDVANDTDPSNGQQSDKVRSPDPISGEPDPLNDIPAEPPGLDGIWSPEEPANPYNADDLSLPNDLPSSPFDKPSKDTNNDAKQLTSDGSQNSETDPKSNQDLNNNPKSSIIQPEKGTASSETSRLIDALLSFGSKILEPLFGTDKSTPSPEKNASTVAPYLQPYANIPGVVGNPILTPEVIKEIERIAAKYNHSPVDLMKVMSFESGNTFDPAKRNAAGSGAVGVIQFMEKTANGLGTTPQALSKMTLLEQLKYVDKFFAQFNRKLKQNPGIEGLYMSVLYPAAIGKPSNYVLFPQSTDPKEKLKYTQNKGLDTDKDSKITVKEATDKVRNRNIKPSSKSSNSQSKGKSSKSKGKLSKGSSSPP